MNSSYLPKVTALVPAYQSAAFIQPTLDSLSAQTYKNFNIIISVDMCSDDTYNICMQHRKRDPRFTVLKQTEQQLGYVGNCNFLLNQADADYVCFSFHDDLLSPTFIEKLAAALNEKPEAILSYPDITCTQVDGTTEEINYTDIDNLQNRVNRGALMLEQKKFWWVPNRGLFRLQQARQIDGLKSHEAGDFSADWPWLFHMSLLGEFVRVPENLCHKIFQQESLSKNWEFSQQQRYAVRSACLRELWSSELSTDEKLELALPVIKKLQRAKKNLYKLNKLENKQAPQSWFKKMLKGL